MNMHQMNVNGAFLFRKTSKLNDGFTSLWNGCFEKSIPDCGNCQRLLSSAQPLKFYSIEKTVEKILYETKFLWQNFIWIFLFDVLILLK